MRTALQTAVLGLLLALLSLPAPAQDKGRALLLPRVFAGWQQQSGARAGADPAQADPAFAAVLKELGFKDFAAATYRQDGDSLHLRAARFADATGAYAAFTFYNSSDMVNIKIGNQGSWAGNRIMFFQGNVLVDARLDRITPTTAGELRELAADLPGSEADPRALPSLPRYLPGDGYVKNSGKYVIGPLELAQLGSPIPAEVVDFQRNAEVVLANYRTSGGEATLVLASYPTPQIAGDRLKAFEACQGSDGRPALYLAKRSGPLVVGVTGPISENEARNLLGLINYRADVTWNERVPTGRDNVGNLLVNIFALTGIILGFALVVGIMFGGVRVLLKRLFPDRVFDRPEDVEIIQLKLRE